MKENSRTFGISDPRLLLTPVGSNIKEESNLNIDALHPKYLDFMLDLLSSESMFNVAEALEFFHAYTDVHSIPHDIIFQIQEILTNLVENPDFRDHIWAIVGNIAPDLQTGFKYDLFVPILYENVKIGSACYAISSLVAINDRAAALLLKDGRKEDLISHLTTFEDENNKNFIILASYLVKNRHIRNQISDVIEILVDIASHGHNTSRINALQAMQSCASEKDWLSSFFDNHSLETLLYNNIDNEICFLGALRLVTTILQTASNPIDVYLSSRLETFLVMALETTDSLLNTSALQNVMTLVSSPQCQHLLQSHSLCDALIAMKKTASFRNWLVALRCLCILCVSDGGANIDYFIHIELLDHLMESIIPDDLAYAVEFFGAILQLLTAYEAKSSQDKVDAAANNRQLDEALNYSIDNAGNEIEAYLAHGISNLLNKYRN